MLSRLGRYEIKAELGRGGFGRVYRAFDPIMGRMVAIKVLNGDGDADLLTRFRNEAAASGGLRHANIVTVHDFGEQDGMPYIVMELIEGVDLQKVITSQTAISLLEKVRVMTQIAAGLGHAHVHNIIHRDVKPANVMLLPDKSVKIMDFGIALASKGTHLRLTPQGAIVGTFRYMAPEQFLGAEPDARSDIFAYGLVFYELLAGVHPFHASEPGALMYNVLHLDPVPVGEMCPGCSEALEAIVSRLLDREPDLRYQILEDVLFDCEPVLLELQRARATELVARARQLKTETQSETAHALIRQALELDPTNQAARELREDLQKDFRRRAIQPRIQSLLRKAEDELTAGNFAGAIERFESALRLDPEDVQIRQGLEKAREHFAASRRLEQLLADANQALVAGELSSAQRHGSEAQSIAPADTRVKELINRVQEGLAERERQRRLSEQLDRARRLIEVQAWAEAGALLVILESEFPGRREVAELSAQARAGKEQDERRQRLTDGLTKAREQIQVGQLEQALDRLHRLAAEFPGSSELQHLLSFAESERRGQLRRQVIERTISGVEAFLLKDQFSEAKECIEAALAAYPGEPVLERELRSVEAAARRSRRRASLEEALRSAATLRSAKRLEEALQILEDFNNQYGAEQAVVELRTAVEAELEEERRAAELRQVVRRAKDLLARENAEPAADFLKQSISRFQHQPQLATLLDVAETRIKEQRKRELVTRVVSASRTRIDAGDYEGAIEYLDEGLKQFPDDTQLLEYRNVALTGLDEQRRRAAIELAVADTSAHLERADFALASEILGAALRRYPDSASSVRPAQEAPKQSEPARPAMGSSFVEPSIEAAEHLTDSLVAPVPSRKGRKIWWLTAAVCVGVAILSFGFFLMRQRSVSQSLQAVAGNTEVHRPMSSAPERTQESEKSSLAKPFAPESSKPTVATGTVLISTKLPGANVICDGSPVGETDVHGQLLFDQPMGRHILRVEKNGFQDYETTVMVADRLVLRVRTSLTPVQTEQANLRVSEAASRSHSEMSPSSEPAGSSPPPISATTPHANGASSNAVNMPLPPPPEIQTQIATPANAVTLPIGLPASPPAAAPPAQRKLGISLPATEANARGLAFIKINKYPEAIASFDDALRATPDFAEAYVNRGAAYEWLGRYKEAIANYDRALSLNPADSLAAERRKDAQHKMSLGVQGVASGASSPVLLSMNSPRYTKEAVAAGAKGIAIVEVIVDENGAATNIKLLKSPGYGLDEEAIRAVKTAKFRPAQKDGKAVPFAVNLEVKFRR